MKKARMVEDPQQIDLTGPELVQIEIKSDGKVLWVNVDGVCVFRACRIKYLTVSDNRNKTERSLRGFKRMKIQGAEVRAKKVGKNVVEVHPEDLSKLRRSDKAPLVVI